MGHFFFTVFNLQTYSRLPTPTRFGQVMTHSKDKELEIIIGVVRFWNFANLTGLAPVKADLYRQTM